MAVSLEFLLSFKLRPPPLEVQQEHQDSFPKEAGKWTLISRWGGKKLSFSWVVAGPSMFLSSGDDYSGNFLSCVKGVNYSCMAQEGKWDFSPDAAAEKCLIPRWGDNLLVFLELRQETWCSSRVTMRTSGTCLCCLCIVKSPCVLWGASRDSSPVSARAEFLICIWSQNVRVLLQCWHGSRGSYVPGSSLRGIQGYPQK